MDTTTNQLQAAREAYGLHQWQTAFVAFKAAAKQRSLDCDDLVAFADAAWWLGRTDDTVRLSEQAFRALAEASRPAEAARVALELAMTLLLHGDEPRATGWIGRARHLTEGIAESRVHGYLLYYTEVLLGLDGPDARRVRTAAQRVQELGRRFGDANLVAAGLNGEGRALIAQGRLDEGMTCIDEAMVSVLGGELAPDLAGTLYCNTIDACRDVCDIRRMARWTELAMAWIGTLPAAALYGGICSVHQAQLLVLQGEWHRAERDALMVAADLDRIDVWVASEAWYVVGDCRRLRGDRSGAEAAYKEAHSRGLDPHPGLALLRLQQGDEEQAATSIRSALAAAVSPRSRAEICAAMVEIGLAVGRQDDAREASEQLTRNATQYPTSGMLALAGTARAAVLLADGCDDQALPALRDACRQWYALGAEYEAARVCVLLARVYASMGDDASADLELARAETVFTRLGAAPALDALAVDRKVVRTPGGLTGREVEVLALVAAGLSNRGIAADLYISDRTVARHLTNIFRKLGVVSRTQAARYALDNGLVRAAR